ncbi:hypothetical protein ACWDTG_24735 [Rhodococcus zopfii]|uniref:hypothetical protein n=1 Tax=Rhodococcus zopfii TaxID=43772 RepID=UPI00365A2A19
MAAVTGLLADRLGEILTRTVRCPCGASVTARSRVVRDTRNRALNTCVDLDFEATRAFLIEHRPHRGRIEAR